MNDSFEILINDHFGCTGSKGLFDYACVFVSDKGFYFNRHAVNHIKKYGDGRVIFSKDHISNDVYIAALPVTSEIKGWKISFAAKQYSMNRPGLRKRINIENGFYKIIIEAEFKGGFDWFRLERIEQ